MSIPYDPPTVLAWAIVAVSFAVGCYCFVQSGKELGGINDSTKYRASYALMMANGVAWLLTYAAWMLLGK